MSCIASWLAITPGQANELIDALPYRDKAVKKLLDELDIPLIETEASGGSECFSMLRK